MLMGLVGCLFRRLFILAMTILVFGKIHNASGEQVSRDILDEQEQQAQQPQPANQLHSNVALATGKWNQFKGFYTPRPIPHDSSLLFASVWAGWSAWSFCTENVQVRVRACNTVRGFSCLGTNREQRQCGSERIPRERVRTTQPVVADSDYEGTDPWVDDRHEALRQLTKSVSINGQPPTTTLTAPRIDTNELAAVQNRRSNVVEGVVSSEKNNRANTAALSPLPLAPTTQKTLPNNNNHNIRVSIDSSTNSALNFAQKLEVPASPIVDHKEIIDEEQPETVEQQIPRKGNSRKPRPNAAAEGTEQQASSTTGDDLLPLASSPITFTPKTTTQKEGGRKGRRKNTPAILLPPDHSLQTNNGNQTVEAMENASRTTMKEGPHFTLSPLLSNKTTPDSVEELGNAADIIIQNPQRQKIIDAITKSRLKGGSNNDVVLRPVPFNSPSTHQFPARNNKISQGKNKVVLGDDSRRALEWILNNLDKDKEDDASTQQKASSQISSETLSKLFNEELIPFRNKKKVADQHSTVPSEFRKRARVLASQTLPNISEAKEAHEIEVNENADKKSDPVIAGKSEVSAKKEKSGSKEDIRAKLSPSDAAVIKELNTNDPIESKKIEMESNSDRELIHAEAELVERDLRKLREEMKKMEHELEIIRGQSEKPRTGGIDENSAELREHVIGRPSTLVLRPKTLNQAKAAASPATRTPVEQPSFPPSSSSNLQTENKLKVMTTVATTSATTTTSTDNYKEKLAKKREEKLRQVSEAYFSAFMSDRNTTKPIELTSDDGEWSDWSAWGLCVCGRQMRNRVCQYSEDLPSSGCRGQSYETRPCVNFADKCRRKLPPKPTIPAPSSEASSSHVWKTTPSSLTTFYTLAPVRGPKYRSVFHPRPLSLAMPMMRMH